MNNTLDVKGTITKMIFKFDPSTHIGIWLIMFRSMYIVKKNEEERDEGKERIKEGRDIEREGDRA